MKIEDCKFEYEQLNMAEWTGYITTPSNKKFSINFHCHPNQNPSGFMNQNLFNSFMDKNQCKNFALDLECEKTVLTPDIPKDVPKEPEVQKEEEKKS